MTPFIKSSPVTVFQISKTTVMSSLIALTRHLLPSMVQVVVVPNYEYSSFSWYRNTRQDQSHCPTYIFQSCIKGNSIKLAQIILFLTGKEQYLSPVCLLTNTSLVLNSCIKRTLRYVHCSCQLKKRGKTNNVLYRRLAGGRGAGQLLGQVQEYPQFRVRRYEHEISGIQDISVSKLPSYFCEPVFFSLCKNRWR